MGYNRIDFHRFYLIFRVCLMDFKTTVMKVFHFLAMVTGVVLLSTFSRCTPKKEVAVKGTFYELRVYTLTDLQQEGALDTYLEQAFLPALKSNDIKDIGVFKQIPGIQDSIRRVYVLYPFEGLGRIAKLHKTLSGDSVLQQKGAEFLKAPHDTPPYERLEVILLKPFKDMPFLRPTSLKGPRDKRVYELRSYESPTEYLYRNKVEMFNEGGEVELFENLGFNAVFYGEVLAGSRMPNLMYMTTFEDMETRDSLWKAFVDSEHWKKLISDPYYANNVNKADIYLLTPAPYSDY